MYLKPCVLLRGFVVSTTFFAYVFEIESKYCVSSTANKEKYVKIFLHILDIIALKKLILPVFDIQG